MLFPVDALPCEAGRMIEILGATHTDTVLDLYCSNEDVWDYRGKRGILLFVRWQEQDCLHWRECRVPADETVNRCLTMMQRWVPAVRACRANEA